MNTFNSPLGGVFAGFLSYGKEYKMKKTLMALTSVATLLCANGAANAAGTIQGTLGVTLTIGAGCVVGGGSSSGSVNDFGSISFGTYSSLANIIDASATGAGGGRYAVIDLHYRHRLHGGAGQRAPCHFRHPTPHGQHGRCLHQL